MFESTVLNYNEIMLEINGISQNNPDLASAYITEPVNIIHVPMT